jgi:multicomponent Na+:H+ antiporter subunit G
VTEVATTVLMLVGSFLLLLASLGIVRMPDIFMRMQAGTKASTLGVALILLAIALHFEGVATTSLAIAGIAFFLLTAPVAAHMISRAAYFTGVELWRRTIIDELKGQYDLTAHVLDSRPGVFEGMEESGLRAPGEQTGPAAEEFQPTEEELED